MKRFLLIAAILLITPFLSSWGPNGHRIVAQICFDNLDPKVQAKVSNVLGDDFLTQVATWPDFIRSEPKWDFTKPWHFITINPGETVEQVIAQSAKNDSIDNVYEAIQLMRGVLAKQANEKKVFVSLMDANGVKPLNNSVEATALAFLVHFIGDIHQPMHVGKNKDLGGNKIMVEFFSEKMNLHSVWDSGIIEQEQLSFTELASFVNKHQHGLKEDCETDPVPAWASESVVAREHIYNTLYDSTDKFTGLPSLSYPYQHDNLDVVEQRLAKAGFRAAYMINSLYKK